MAAGSAVRARTRRRRHDDADSARVWKSVRGPRRDRQERPVAYFRRDEVSRRAARTEDGLRRESEARLRRTQFVPGDVDGQHGGISQGLDRRDRLPRQVEEVARRGIGSGEAARARSADGDARRRPGWGHPRPQPLLSRRRDGVDDQSVEGVRLPDHVVPSRRGGLQGARPARGEQRLREHVGRLVGIQARGVRRHQREHRARQRGEGMRDRPLG